MAIKTIASHNNNNNQLESKRRKKRLRIMVAISWVIIIGLSISWIWFQTEYFSTSSIGSNIQSNVNNNDNDNKYNQKEKAYKDKAPQVNTLKFRKRHENNNINNVIPNWKTRQKEILEAASDKSWLKQTKKGQQETNNNESSDLLSLFNIGHGRAPGVPNSCQDFDHSFLTPDHGCVINPSTYIPHCQFNDFRIDISLIDSERGGEPLESVLGHEARMEFPNYKPGALFTKTQPNLPSQTTNADPNSFQSYHYLKSVLKNLRYLPEDQQNLYKEQMCTPQTTWNGTTLFITRYEYVNLYHSMTDFWNGYFTMPDPTQNYKVVFLDAHAKGNLDSVWSTLFGGPVTFVQHLPQNVTCFERAVFIPPGYASQLYHQHFKMKCPDPKVMSRFTNFVLECYQVKDIELIPGKVVIIERVPYNAHPTSKPESAQRIVTNLKDLQQTLEKLPGVTSVELVRFETLTFKEQLTMIRQTHILIGNHGAGLTHLLFLNSGATVLELTTQYLDFFAYLSDWCPDISLHRLYIPSSGTHALSARTIEDLSKRTLAAVNKK